MHENLEIQYIKEKKTTGHTNIKLFDSTRGVFLEGAPIYKGAEIFEKSHIQICIRNPNCIKGLFIPRKAITFLPAAA